MNKYKKLMGNTLIFGVGSFGTKVLGFILVALYTRVMTKEEYSAADMIYNIVNVFVPVVTFGMSDAVIRFGMDKGYDCRRVYTCANMCTLAGMALLMLFTPLINGTRSMGGYAFWIYAMCFCSCFRLIASQFVRARGHVKLFALDGIITVLIQVICNLIFLLGFKMGVKGYVLSIILSDTFSFCFLLLIAQLGRYFDTRFLNRGVLSEMLKFSAPLIPTYLLWWITSASDRFFVINMVGEEANGVYALGYKLPTLLMLVTTMFFQAWQMSSIEERDSRYLGKFYENVFGAYSSLLFIAAAGLIMLCKPLTYLLAGKDFTEAYLFTPILVTAMVFQCFCQFLSSVYSTKKKSVNSCMTSAVAAAVNIVLNILLIPRYGCWGAAIATAAAYFACFCVRLFDVRKFIFFKVDYFRFIVNAAIVVVMTYSVGMQTTAYGLQNVIIFIISLVFNFDAVIRTLRRILSGGGRGRRRNDAAS